MSPRVFLLALLVAATSAQAQRASDLHVLEIRDGQIYRDGRMLAGAVPEGMDLTAWGMALEYSDPLIPVLDIDGQAYVVENDRLVRFEESTRSGQTVYMLSDVAELSAQPMAAPPAALARQMSEAAYVQDVASGDRELYLRLQQERQLELEADGLAARVRSLPHGDERTRLKARLRDQLAQIFDLKQEVRREEVARAQAQIDAVRTELDARDQRRAAIIDARLGELCGDE